MISNSVTILLLFLPVVRIFYLMYEISSLYILVQYIELF